MSSRGQLDEPEKVKSLAFPGSLLRALRPEFGRREGSLHNVALTFSQDSSRVCGSWLPVG